MKLKVLMSSFLAAFGLKAGELNLGTPLPDMSGKNHFGEVVKIESAKDHEWLLVFFYPKALTGG